MLDRLRERVVLSPEHETVGSEPSEKKPPRRASLGVLLVLAGMVITLAWIGLLIWATIRLFVMLL